MARRSRTKALIVTATVLAAVAMAVTLLPRGSNEVKDALRDLRKAYDDVQEWAQERHDDPRTSPFEDVTWSGSRPRVKVGGDWYALESVDGWALEDLIAHIEGRHGRDRVEKRFEEDLPMLLREGWKRPRAEVLLRLRSDDGTVTEQQVLMTEANRRRHWERRGGP